MAQRRTDGLCFNCPKKFTKDHHKSCTMKGVYLMELAEDAPMDDTLATL